MYTVEFEVWKTAYCNTAYMGVTLFTSAPPIQTLVSTCTAQFNQSTAGLHDTIVFYSIIWRSDWCMSLWTQERHGWRSVGVVGHPRVLLLKQYGSMDDCKLEFVIPNISQLNGYVTSEPTTIHSLPWYVYHPWEIFVHSYREVSVPCSLDSQRLKVLFHGTT